MQTMPVRTRSRSRTLKRTDAQLWSHILDEQKALVASELQEVVELEDNSFSRSLYLELASDSAIDSFLKKSRFYSLTGRRWKLPRDYTKLISDSNCLLPVFNVVASIVKWFWASATAEGHRQVLDAHATDLGHWKDDPPSHTSRPSFVIQAQGPSFQLPSRAPGEVQGKFGFSNIAGCIEVNVGDDDVPVDEQLARVAIYARQLFIHQPNRRFVRTLFLTGHLLRLFHFDRSGVQYTPPLDVHEDPYTFVRLVLGMSSPNEADIGLDTSIRWTVENGRKIAGTLTSRGEDDVELVYPLLDIEPCFSRSVFRGRCTTCWRVSHPITGEELLVKDSWRSEDRTSEHVFLRMARGIPGVAQMISCEPGRGETKDLRSFGLETPDSFHNRIETRVIVQFYHQPISKFSSAGELLCSLRDAMEGHRQLLNKGVLHRDISIQNILKGRPGARPGHRAILIDLDMALRYTADSNEPTDWRIGHFLYQPISALRGRALAEPLVHDHLDDLESFFYILSFIIYAYDSQGTFHSVPDTFQEWIEQAENQRMLAKLKHYFLVFSVAIPIEISSRWPAALLDVFHGFRCFIEKVARQKDVVIVERPVDGRNGLRALRMRADEHYDYILGLFDNAILTLEKDELSASPTVLPPSSSTKAQDAIGMPRSPSKRSSEDDPDGQPVPKRPNSPRNTPSS
ncbi:hypothetical protein MD484_g6317, partial [Candolleomyces efflorescens]